MRRTKVMSSGALALLTVSAIVPATAGPASADTGATWQVMSVPSTSWDRTINAIAPISATDAIAVGSIEEEIFITEWHALVWRFDGTRWQEQAAPPDAGELTSVAAASANDVWAVSDSVYNPGYAEGAYMNRWNGTAWQTTRLPDHPSGGKLSANGVAVAGGTVWVVGSYETAPATWPDTNPAPAVLRWNGTDWAYVSVPTTTGEAYLSDVQARSANDVWATGVERVTGGERPYIVHWDGTRWSRMTTSSTVSGVQLLGGIVRGNGEMWSGGGSTDADGALRYTYAMRSTGGGWTVTPTPRAANLRSYITTFGERGSELWAGGDGETPLLRWTGTAWQQGPAPALHDLGVTQLVAAPDGSMWATGRGNADGESLSGPFIARLSG